jgi:hypothetical protein
LSLHLFVQLAVWAQQLTQQYEGVIVCTNDNNLSNRLHSFSPVKSINAVQLGLQLEGLKKHCTSGSLSAENIFRSLAL